MLMVWVLFFMCVFDLLGVMCFVVVLHNYDDADKNVVLQCAKAPYFVLLLMFLGLLCFVAVLHDDDDLNLV